MEEDRMPTLFEILNRFSKPPVDLWSFYVYLKEHYGGVEYLEFWLDCASHTALCKDLARGIIKARQSNMSAPSEHEDNAFSETGDMNYDDEDGDHLLPPALKSPTRKVSSTDERFNNSPSSSVLFDILRDDALDTSSEKHSGSGSGSGSGSHNLGNEEHDQFDMNSNLPIPPNGRYSTLSYERARNKRDTVSRLSEILDNMRMPEYPGATATSPTRNRKASQELDYNSSENNGYFDGPAPREKMSYENPADANTAGLGGFSRFSARNPPSTPPPQVTLTSASRPQNTNPTDPYLLHKVPGARAESGSSQSYPKRAIRESALRIINTYLNPKAPKEIELPSDQQGWSMAEDIRQLCIIPKGLDNPKVFENATTYVFEALEREALPGFLVHSALSNVQPVSATFRLIGGLIALFGAFWLSFVYVLLDWQPKAHRCWVLLPFSVGWYLTITGLYHIDPLLAFSRLSEKDGGGIIRIQEKFVWKIQSKRATFVVASTVLLTAAFCVLFILVPGHRL